MSAYPSGEIALSICFQALYSYTCTDVALAIMKKEVDVLGCQMQAGRLKQLSLLRMFINLALTCSSHCPEQAKCPAMGAAFLVIGQR